jgi:hypothetical protein
MDKKKFAKQVFKWSLMFFFLPFTTVIFLGLSYADFINVSEDMLVTLQSITGIAVVLPVLGLIVAILFLSMPEEM